MKIKTPLIVIGLILVLALFAGTWQTNVFAATVPPVVPPAPPVVIVVPPIIPVTGNCVVAPSIKGRPLLADLSGAFKTGVDADVVKPGREVKICLVDPNNIPDSGGVISTGSIVYVTVQEKGKELRPILFSRRAKVTFVLTQDEVDAFKKDPTLGVLWYNETDKRWVRFIAVLDGNELTVYTNRVGMFMMGKLK
jgi:hypothetical protein